MSSDGSSDSSRLAHHHELCFLKILLNLERALLHVL